jgi:2-iminobutanoate/2-iminopropanoate deaminase
MLRLLFFALLLSGTAASAQKRVIESDLAPAPIGPYSQAIEVNGTVYVSGQIGLIPGAGKLVAGGIDTEVPRIMENIQAILKAANLTLREIVSTTIYVKNMADFPRINKLYESYFTGEYPARSTVGVADLPAGANVEIAVIAVRRKY